MTQTFDVEAVRRDFPILSTEVNGSPLVYLDNGATTQKPAAVIEAIDNYYRTQNSNVHRGVHTLSQEATTAYEHARENIQQFINAKHSHECLFTRGTTDSINLVATAYGNQNIKVGDEILISTMEHHSNIVPWQMLCERTGANLKVIGLHQDGSLDHDSFDSLLSEKTKILALPHVSNSLGTVNPIAELIVKAHSVGAKVLIDGAQGAPHYPVDVQALDVDFYTLSAHKLFGPTGVGVLYGKEALLNAMPPYQGGGNMIQKVTFEKTTYNELPHKYEPGTPNIVGGIGLGAAIDYLNQYDPNEIIAHEQAILAAATKGLQEIEGVRIIGTSNNKASVISFLLDGAHPFDVGTLLDQQGIAVRTGHHCCQPLMDFYNIPGTIRASFSLYNNQTDVDTFLAAMRRAAKMLS
ncbi:MAG: cysteine desulfurase/selenocysteine lyase [Saprospiraceae bacterium]|jgi:cysteine desulfurase/selenocysteine lyase